MKRGGIYLFKTVVCPIARAFGSGHIPSRAGTGSSTGHKSLPTGRAEGSSRVVLPHPTPYTLLQNNLNLRIPGPSKLIGTDEEIVAGVRQIRDGITARIDATFGEGQV